MKFYIIEILYILYLKLFNKILNNIITHFTNSKIFKYLRLHEFMSGVTQS